MSVVTLVMLCCGSSVLSSEKEGKKSQKALEACAVIVLQEQPL